MTAVITEPLEAVEGIVKKAIVASVPKFDEIVAVDVLFNEGGNWFTMEMSWKDYLSTLRNGLINDGLKTVQLVAICVNEKIIELEDGSTEKVRIIYDFVLKHAEHDPWRIS